MSSADQEPGTSGRQETANGNPVEQQTHMAVEAVAEQPGTSMRVLALYCTSSGSGQEQDQGFDPPDGPNINHLASRQGIEVSRRAVRSVHAPALATCNCITAFCCVCIVLPS